ncbi:hypothetical protein L1987_71077 [Smallanthus sonchifolius]|uniref:Uncharacterized protein n=1 Tax=Smallanthus sonchifolius TaxID=185202 RepID=A0ACB9AR34_9ASTR|nr:hypothetical protein L1987_71077 [Smallanthus sonchifolius]
MRSCTLLTKLEILLIGFGLALHFIEQITLKNGMQQSSQDGDSASWEYSESHTRVGAVFNFQKKSEDYFCSKVFL